MGAEEKETCGAAGDMVKSELGSEQDVSRKGIWTSQTVKQSLSP
jgi:hypothetical protein